MEDLLSFLGDARRRLLGPQAAKGFAVASVVRSRGSTPRKSGARLVIDPVEGVSGTIGGGCGEAEVLARAQRTLATGVPQLIEVSLLEDDGFDSASICGGILDVFVERFGENVGGIPAPDFFAQLDEARLSGPVVVVTVVSGEEAFVGRKTLVGSDGRSRFSLGSELADRLAAQAVVQSLEKAAPVWLSSEALARAEKRNLSAGGGEIGTPVTASSRAPWEVCAEPVIDSPQIVVVGAGHVGQAVVELGSRAGFSLCVLDDREAFANPVRLPDASLILVGDPRERLRELAPHPQRYIVLVTRGHRLDAECLEVALQMDPAYVGMIGSRRRARGVREWLEGRGVASAALERVHAPIGAEIGAETPAEIAVSILAEIIAERRK